MLVYQRVSKLSTKLVVRFPTWCLNPSSPLHPSQSSIRVHPTSLYTVSSDPQKGATNPHRSKHGRNQECNPQADWGLLNNCDTVTSLYLHNTQTVFSLLGCEIKSRLLNDQILYTNQKYQKPDDQSLHQPHLLNARWQRNWSIEPTCNNRIGLILWSPGSAQKPPCPPGSMTSKTLEPIPNKSLLHLALR